MASVSLRCQEGDALPQAVVTPAEEEAADQGGKKGKKGVKKGHKGAPAGLGLGKGTTVLRSAVEARLLVSPSAALASEAFATLSLEDLKTTSANGLSASWLEVRAYYLCHCHLPFPNLELIRCS